MPPQNPRPRPIEQLEFTISLKAAPGIAARLAELGSVSVSGDECSITVSSDDPVVMMQKARRLAELMSELVPRDAKGLK